MKTVSMNIAGMSCSHCVMSVRAHLSKIAQVKELTLGKAIVEIDEQNVTVDALKKAVDDAGYSVVAVS